MPMLCDSSFSGISPIEISSVSHSTSQALASTGCKLPSTGATVILSSRSRPWIEATVVERCSGMP